jgi:non-heme chloroperoxidase
MSETTDGRGSARAPADAGYKRQLKNPGVTQIVKNPGRGHALTLDSG